MIDVLMGTTLGHFLAFAEDRGQSQRFQMMRQQNDALGFFFCHDWISKEDGLVNNNDW